MIARKFAGKRGSAGPQGTAGTTGKDGSNGANGDQGDKTPGHQQCRWRERDITSLGPGETPPTVGPNFEQHRITKQ